MKNQFTCIVDGEEWHTYSVEYPFDGRMYGFEIKARSFEEAEARRDALVFGRILGRLEAVVPAVPGAGAWVRFVCWFKNRFA